MNQFEHNQDAIKEDMLIMRAQMGQLMEVIQVMARCQEEIRQSNLGVTTAIPSITLLVNQLGGIGTAIVTQTPPEGGLVNKNVGPTFNIHVNGGAHPEMDDHRDDFFISKVDSIYDAFGPPTAEVEKKFCVLEEKMKAIEGSGALGWMLPTCVWCRV